MFTFVAFDIETTGTRADKDKIIEIGAVRFVDAKPLDSFQSFVCIEQIIPSSATRIHGITNDMLIGQPPLHEALEGFTSFCTDAVLLAHNANFDTKFITQAAISECIALPQKPILDSYQIAKKAFPDFLNHRLTSLLEKLNIHRENAHRASDDALACGLVFLQCLKAIAKRGEKIDGSKLIQWSGQKLNFPIIEPQPRQLTLL